MVYILSFCDEDNFLRDVGRPVDGSGNAVSGKVAIGGAGPDKVVGLSAGGSIRIEK